MRRYVYEGVQLYVNQKIKPNYAELARQYDSDYRTVKTAYEQGINIKKYVEKFNRNDNEIYIQDIPNENAEEWMINEIPYFESHNSVLEETYYFRWCGMETLF